MKRFSYQAATSVEEAVALLDEYRLRAGGADILVHLRRGRHDPDPLGDAKRSPEMLNIDYDPTEGLTVAAAVSKEHSDHRPIERGPRPGARCHEDS